MKIGAWVSQRGKQEEVDALPEDEQGVLIKIISAYVRDFKAKQAYAS
ncbi:MAG: hypothetical protein JST23_02775 [Bacteroidetes bacterium]|nr:hypothetical protein [Bacteroidota bacterium]